MHVVMTKGSSQGSVRWIHEEMVGDVVLFRAGKHGPQMVADWPGLARLTCAPDGSSAKLVPAVGASRREIGKLRRGQVRALLRDLGGQLALHASAVAIDGHAVLFIGPDGAGKSTAAAEMCLRHHAQMFADDSASIEVNRGSVRVLPSEMDHWLTRESCTALGIEPGRGEGDAKRDMRASRVGREPSPLALVVALRFDPTAEVARLRPLRGSDAGRLLLEAAIRFDVDDATARQREFEQVTTVYHCAPVVELVRRQEGSCAVTPFVLQALEGAGL